LGTRRTLRVVVAELLNLGTDEFTINLAAALEEARPWLAERVAHIRALAADPTPKAGRDCLGCRFVAGCRAHRDA
jgi:hypothetical protein